MRHLSSPRNDAIVGGGAGGIASCLLRHGVAGLNGPVARGGSCTYRMTMSKYNIADVLSTDTLWDFLLACKNGFATSRVAQCSFSKRVRKFVKPAKAIKFHSLNIGLDLVSLGICVIHDQCSTCPTCKGSAG